MPETVDITLQSILAATMDALEEAGYDGKVLEFAEGRRVVITIRWDPEDD
jgi:hypothetical protein